MEDDKRDVLEEIVSDLRTAADSAGATRSHASQIAALCAAAVIHVAAEFILDYRQQAVEQRARARGSRGGRLHGTQWSRTYVGEDLGEHS